MGNYNISITGDLGSGKSSVAVELCKRLNFKYLSTGSMQREIAREKGMDTLQLNYFSENNVEIDEIIDARIKNISNLDESFVLDSRLAWFFVNKSFKLYLSVNPEVAAKRVLMDKERTGEPAGDDIKTKALNLLERRSVENRRFKRIYDVDCADLNNYNLVVDTTNSSVKEIVSIILEFYNLWVSGLHFSKFWASPRTFFPTEPVSKVLSESAKDISREMKEIGFDALYPIKVVKHEEFMFILDGHKRTSAALNNEINFIPYTIIDDAQFEAMGKGTVKEFIDSSFNLSQVQDWEEMHHFKHDIYPLSDG